MTKEGRLVAEIANQIRQKNLCVMLCVPEVLSLDWLIQKKLNCIVLIWENRRQQGDHKITIKGCCAVYPEIPNLPLKSLFINYQRKKKVNPMLPNRPPQPMFQEPGDGITKKPWYPFGESAYRAKKESVLEKYRQKEDGDKKTGVKVVEVVKEKEKPITERDIKEKMIYDLRTHQKHSFRKISSLIGMPKSTIQDYYGKFTRKLAEQASEASNVVTNREGDNILEKKKINGVSFNTID